MATSGKNDTADDGEEMDFEFITSARQLAAAPPLRNEMVSLDDWHTASGKVARFMVWELTAADYADFYDEGRIYDKGGMITGYDAKGEDIRYLAWTIRDRDGNRIWPKTADATPVLGRLGKASLNVLLNAANLVNSPRESGGKGNSDSTQTDS